MALAIPEYGTYSLRLQVVLNTVLKRLFFKDVRFYARGTVLSWSVSL